MTTMAYQSTRLKCGANLMRTSTGTCSSKHNLPKDRGHGRGTLVFLKFDVKVVPTVQMERLDNIVLRIIYKFLTMLVVNGYKLRYLPPVGKTKLKFIYCPISFPMSCYCIGLVRLNWSDDLQCSMQLTVDDLSLKFCKVYDILCSFCHLVLFCNILLKS